MSLTRAAFLRILGGAIATVAIRRTCAAADKRPVVIGYVPSAAFTPVFVATEAGHFDALGLAPNMTPIKSGQDAMALLAQGQFDLVTAGISAAFFNALNRGFDVKVVGSTGFQPREGAPNGLMVREDLYQSGLRTVPALRGKKIAWIGAIGATGSYYVATILRKYSMSVVRDIEHVALSAADQAIALSRGAVDGVFAAAPSPGLFEARKLARVIALPPAGMSTTAILFGPTLLKQAETRALVMQALRRASADLAGDGQRQPRNVDAVAKYTKLAPDVIKNSGHYDFDPNLRIDEATLEDMQAEFMKMGVLAYKSPVSVASMVARL